MLCPRCRSGRSRRSRRRSWTDYAVSVAGLRPWRCRSCGLRFFAWSVALPFLRFAHCRRCGNLDLQRISHHHVDGWSAWFFRVMYVPAYRCEPCRQRFFAVLPNRHLRAVDEEIIEPEETDQPTAVSAR